MLVAFIQNAALLITLSVLYGIIKWYRLNNRFYYQILQGSWFGVVAIAAMMMPFHFMSGTFYDGRSVILTLAGFWGGGLTAVVSVLLAGTYRAYLGGAGIWAGLTTILFCSLTGLFFRCLFKSNMNELKIRHFLFVGMVAHLVMLASQLLLPAENRILVISNIWLPVLLIFPVTFAFISRLFQFIGRYITSEQRIRDGELLYRTTLLSIGDAVICTDNQGRITQMNTVAEELTGWEFTEAMGIKLDKVFRIINEESRGTVVSPFEKVMNSGAIVGLANHTLLISKNGTETPIADSGAPIKNEKGEITGVVLVFRDQTEERKYQKELIQSEAKYREREFWLTESQKAGKIGSYDLDIVADHWTSSEVLDEIFGITKENPHNLEGWQVIVHPEQQQEMQDYFLQHVVKGKSPFNKDYKIIRQNDGAERWVFGRGELIFNERGEPVRMFGTIQDITERKLFELQLQESEERFRKSVLLAPIPIMVHDEDGNIINFSEGWSHFSGYKIEEIPTLKEWTEKAYGEKAKEVEEYVNGLFKEDKTVLSGEFEIIAKSGEKRIWNFYTTPLGKLNSGKRIMLSMAPDITQRKRVQKELEESERAYRSLFENHTAIKLLIDPENGQVVKANQAAAEFYGWSIEKLQSMNIGEINTLPSEKIREAMDYARTKRRVYFEFKHRLANGRIRDVEVYASRTEYAGKQLLHSIVHDITEKKRLFDELVTAKERAEESERLKTAFLANMSHEIRTPLNGILGFTSLMAEDGNLTSENKKEYASIVNKSAEGLLKIINDILDISRLETGKANIEQKPFDLGKTLSTIYSIFQKKLADTGKKEVELIVQKLDTPLVLNTDETRLIQIFSNLIDNALRFTPKGSVTFGVSKQNENNVEFFVADTGVGIPKEKHEEIFERFSQADNSSTRSYGGTGLGLAIVKKLLELMGSEIIVESESGQGACFRFQLPFLMLNKTEDKGGVNKTEISLGIYKSRILVVEDDSVSRIYFRQILVNHSAVLFFAETGKEALHLFESQNPDIILMDIGLPDMSGLEVVRKIREKDKQVVIIAQTAYAMPDDMQKALEAGCNDYIAKPVKTEILLEKINAFCN
jgi:PAS domain S-box-containing protein